MLRERPKSLNLRQLSRQQIHRIHIKPNSREANQAKDDQQDDWENYTEEKGSHEVGRPRESTGYVR